MLFFNTRPLERAEALTLALSDLNIQAINLPLLELKARPLTPLLKQLYQQLVVDIAVLVVVSPTAVDVGMKYLRECHIEIDQLAHIQWIAVGEKTAEALQKYQIKSEIPKVETSEGMLQLPILSTLEKGKKIAFWRGEGGRQFMMNHLHQQGMQILNFILYDRQLPLQSINEFQKITLKLTQESRYIMLISSEASWLNWLSLIQANPMLLNIGYFWVLGDRLFNILDNYKIQHDLHFKVMILPNLKTELILQRVTYMQGKL